MFFFQLNYNIASIQEVLISQLCAVVSQGLCLEKIEAKLMLQYIPFRYAFQSMVIWFSCFSVYTLQTKPFNVILFTSLFCAALNLIFSFTNGVDWDGPYRLQFEVPKALKNKPIEFFNRVMDTTIYCFYIFTNIPMTHSYPSFSYTKKSYWILVIYLESTFHFYNTFLCSSYYSTWDFDEYLLQIKHYATK